MTERMRQNLEALNRELDDLEALLRQHSHEALNRPAANGGWSALQCVHHLILSEQGINNYVQKKLSFQPDLPAKGFQDRWRHLLLEFYLRSPVKFSAPKGIGTEYLPPESEIGATIATYRSLREKLAQDMAAIDASYLDRLVFKHPLAGRVSLDTTLSFMLAHFKRHRRQAERVLREQKS